MANKSYIFKQGDKVKGITADGTVVVGTLYTYSINSSKLWVYSKGEYHLVDKDLLEPYDKEAFRITEESRKINFKDYKINEERLLISLSDYEIVKVFSEAL